MSIYNYFVCRWRSGYGYVSDARNEVNLAIEDFLSNLGVSAQSGTSVMSGYSNKTRTLMTAIRYAAYIESTGRSLAFSHVVAIEGASAHPGNNTIVRQALTAIYGSAPSALIHGLIEKFSTMEKEQGRTTLETLKVSLVRLEEHGRLAKGETLETEPSVSSGSDEDPAASNLPALAAGESSGYVSGRTPLFKAINISRRSVVALILGSYVLGYFTHFYASRDRLEPGELLKELRAIKESVKNFQADQEKLNEIAKRMSEFKVGKDTKRPEADGEVYEISATSANVRQSPETGKVLVTLARNARLKIGMVQGEWAQALDPDGRVHGWIYMKLLRKIEMTTVTE